jgi:hypothetical protein
MRKKGKTITIFFSQASWVGGLMPLAGLGKFQFTQNLIDV